MNSRNAVFQAHLNRLLLEPSIKIAIFCFAPYPGAQSLRFESSPNYVDAWSIVEAEVAVIRRDGKSEVKDEAMVFKSLNCCHA